MNGDAQLIEILQLTNASRAAAGMNPLRNDSRLGRAAQLHAEFLAAGGFLSHGGSGESTPGDRATAAGYRWQRVGENILARTRAEPALAYEQWWLSQGHRDNLLTAAFTDCGLGRHYSPKVDCWYYAMLLATPS
ncbi:MAG: polymerase [Hydrocarboniphaga sp.]|uniref:CAP domain-containing protein n=1 Tax=Hydrocarboniphaga sp. TaxID=2033016 RepID=UPI002609B206|nr:CAP domain-containing protein [Hydrocarboniphaga sp.]MDB5972930.1 polymerase [Hydrocarboniphaga sp.]